MYHQQTTVVTSPGPLSASVPARARDTAKGVSPKLDYEQSWEFHTEGCDNLLNKNDAGDELNQSTERFTKTTQYHSRLGSTQELALII